MFYLYIFFIYILLHSNFLISSESLSKELFDNSLTFLSNPFTFTNTNFKIEIVEQDPLNINTPLINIWNSTIPSIADSKFSKEKEKYKYVLALIVILKKVFELHYQKYPKRIFHGMCNFISYCKRLNDDQNVYVENENDYAQNLFQPNPQIKQITGQRYPQPSQVNTMSSSQKTDEKFIEWAKALIFDGICLSKNYLEKNKAEYIFRGQELNPNALVLTFYNENSLENVAKNEKGVIELNFTRKDFDDFRSKVEIAIQVVQASLQTKMSEELATLRTTINNAFATILDTQKQTVKSDTIKKIQGQSGTRTRGRGDQNLLGNDKSELIYKYLRSLYDLDTSYDNLLKIKNELLKMDFEALSIRLNILGTLYESNERYKKVEEFLKIYIKILQDFLSASERYQSIFAFNRLLNNEWTIFTSFVNNIQEITQNDNKNSKEKVAKNSVRFSDVGDNTTESEKLIEATTAQSVLLTFFYKEMTVNVETKLQYFYNRLTHGYINNNDDFYDTVESLLRMDRAEEKMTSEHFAQSFQNSKLEESKNNNNIPKSLNIEGQLSTTVINNKTNKNVTGKVFGNTPSKTEQPSSTSTNLKIDDFKFNEVSIGDTGTKKTQPVSREQTDNPAQPEQQLPSQSQSLKFEDFMNNVSNNDTSSTQTQPTLIDKTDEISLSEKVPLRATIGLEDLKLEKARLEEERLEQARLEKERLEKARLEKERLEKERLAKEVKKKDSQSSVSTAQEEKKISNSLSAFFTWIKEKAWTFGSSIATTVYQYLSSWNPWYSKTAPKNQET